MATPPLDGAVDDGVDIGVDAGVPRYEVPPCTDVAGPFAPLSTRCRQLVDAQGRVALLRGVNARVQGVFDVTFSDGRTALEPIPVFTDADAAQMQSWGFDVLRLPVNWSAIEPTDTMPPTYDDAYLDRVAAIVELCRAHGILVLVDFHQDAYSKEIGEDGAPLWAIQPPPSMLLSGPLTDLGTRRTSAQTLAASQTFFGDAAPGPMLRDRYAWMAAHVAARFTSDDAVVGYDLYNEPVANDDQVRRVNEQTASAIRAVDPRHLVFFEPPVQPRGLIDTATHSDTPFAVPGAVYAPHGYTLSFDATDAQRMSFTRTTLRRSHTNAIAEAESWSAALFIGEWGYGPTDIRASDYYIDQLDIQDELFESSTFWVWKEESQGSWGLFDHDPVTDAWTPRRAVVDPLSTLPRVERLAGWPIVETPDPSFPSYPSYRFEGDASVTAPNVVWFQSREVNQAICDGVAGPLLPDGFSEVACGGPGLHTLVLQSFNL